MGPLLVDLLVLASGAPGGEVDQALALPLDVGAEGGLPLGGAAAVVHLVEDVELGLVDGVALDDLVGAVHLPQLGGELLQVRAGLLVQLRDLRDVLDAQVDRVDEAAGRRQVGGVLGRREGLRGVHRVDQQEVGAGLLRQDLRQLPHVVEVAQTPGLLGPHRVHLRHDAGDRLLHVAVGGGQAGRGDDERALVVGVVRLQGDAVPAERQVARDAERRLAPGLAVDGDRRVPVLLLVGGTHGTVLEDDLDVGRRAVVDVHVEGPGVTGDGDDARRQRTDRLRGAVGVEGGAQFSAVGGVGKRHTEGTQRLEQRVVGDGDLLPVTGGVARGDAVGVREFSQHVLVSHTAHPAISVVVPLEPAGCGRPPAP